MLGQALSGWGFGLLIERARNRRPLARAALIGSIVVGIGGLIFFKYTDFLIGNVNSLFGLSVGALKIALPIGISFYTFQILSYDFDLYLRKTSVQRNFFTLATYVTFFPQLIAGPIVRYVDVERELRSRTHTAADFASGAHDLTRNMLLYLLDEIGAVRIGDSIVREIGAAAVRVEGRDWRYTDLAADYVVDAFGMVKNTAMADRFFELIPDVYYVGDCLEVKNIMHANFTAYDRCCNI
jgi:hypothetical protein